MDNDQILRPVARLTTRTDLVADSIREAILSGRIRPGETLVERRLAEQLGVSKTPVREALIGLASTGLVVISPNRGVTVRTLGPEDLRKAYEVRLLLEPWAVAQTAALGSAEFTPRQNTPPEAAAVSSSDPASDVLSRAERALKAAESLLSGDDRAALSLANRWFHRELYAACGNELVVSQLDNLQDLAALGAVSVLWERWPTWRAEYDEHAAILGAVRDGDAALAERLARRHLKQSVTHLGAAGTV